MTGVGNLIYDWSDEKGSRVKIPHELVTVIEERGEQLYAEKSLRYAWEDLSE